VCGDTGIKTMQGRAIAREPGASPAILLSITTASSSLGKLPGHLRLLAAIPPGRPNGTPGRGPAAAARGRSRSSRAAVSWVAFHAHSSITRHDFGLTYELLKEAGGLLVGRDVAIDIDAEAIRPQ
jgi:hypothetical protein